MLRARFFDGRISRERQVVLRRNGDVLRLDGEDVSLAVPLREVEVGEATGNGRRMLVLPDGGRCELDTGPELESFLAVIGHRDRRVARWQGRWSIVVGSLLVGGVALVAAYRVGLPWLAERLARTVPERWVQIVGTHTLATLDRTVFEPSQLGRERLEHLRTLVAGLKDPSGGLPRHVVELRECPALGANAFALPGGNVVVTDALVEIASDDELLGALAHELGHLHERHALRQLIQSSAVATVAAYWFGDVSGLAAGVSASLLAGQVLARLRDRGRRLRGPGAARQRAQHARAREAPGPARASVRVGGRRTRRRRLPVVTSAHRRAHPAAARLVRRAAMASTPAGWPFRAAASIPRSMSSHTPETVLLERDGAVLLVTLNRPGQRNALNRQMWRELREAFVDAQDDAGRARRGGHGERQRVLGRSGSGRDVGRGRSRGSAPSWTRLCEFDKPLLAAVNGVGVGFGLTLLLHCDVVYIAEGARLRPPFVTLGVVPEAASSHLLPAIIGWQRAAEALFTADWIDAERAVELGIASRLCRPTSCCPPCAPSRQRIARQPPQAVRHTKRS